MNSESSFYVSLEMVGTYSNPLDQTLSTLPSTKIGALKHPLLSPKNDGGTYDTHLVYLQNESNYFINDCFCEIRCTKSELAKLEWTSLSRFGKSFFESDQDHIITREAAQKFMMECQLEVDELLRDARSKMVRAHKTICLRSQHYAFKGSDIRFWFDPFGNIVTTKKFNHGLTWLIQFEDVKMAKVAVANYNIKTFRPEIFNEFGCTVDFARPPKSKFVNSTAL